MNLNNVIIHYAKNRIPDPRWQDRQCKVLIRSRGKGPRNLLVQTDIGKVVVPRWNVREGIAGE